MAYKAYLQSVQYIPSAAPPATEDGGGTDVAKVSEFWMEVRFSTDTGLPDVIKAYPLQHNPSPQLSAAGTLLWYTGGANESVILDEVTPDLQILRATETLQLQLQQTVGIWSAVVLSLGNSFVPRALPSPVSEPLGLVFATIDFVPSQPTVVQTAPRTFSLAVIVDGVVVLKPLDEFAAQILTQLTALNDGSEALAVLDMVVGQEIPTWAD